MNFDAPANVGHELKQSASIFPSTMKIAASEPSKYQPPNTDSRSSRLAEPRGLESQANVLEQESRMAVEKTKGSLS